MSGGAIHQAQFLLLALLVFIVGFGAIVRLIDQGSFVPTIPPAAVRLEVANRAVLP
jgi:hypothetical protein